MITTLIEEVAETGTVLTTGGAGGDGGESIFGMKSENKFLALADVLPLPLGQQQQQVEDMVQSSGVVILGLREEVAHVS